MPYRLRKNLKRLRVGGKRARQGCFARCCRAQDYYRAVRCDVAHPPERDDIPPEIPREFIFEVGFRCDNMADPCAVDGGRVLIYGGYCYEVEAVDPPEFQNPPCDTRRRARTYRLADFETPPPIANWADLVCKPLGTDCTTDPTCLPEGACCGPALTCGPGQPTPCHPCPCPQFARWALRVSWDSQSASSFPAGESATYRTTGQYEAIIECVLGSPTLIRRVSHTGSVTRIGTRSQFSIPAPPRGNYSGPLDYNPAIGRFGFSPELGEGRDELTEQPFVCELGAGNYNGGPPYCTCAFDNDESSEFHTLSHHEAASMSATCYGGGATYTANYVFRDLTPGGGTVTHSRTASASWSWVPLLACPGSDGLYPGSPPPVPPVGAVPLTMELLRKMLAKSGGLK